MTNLPEEQLTDGPLDALVERYRAELKRLNYGRATISIYLRSIDRLCRLMEKHGVALDGLTPDMAAELVLSADRHCDRQQYAVFIVKRFASYLAALGVAKPPEPPTPRELARAALRGDYEDYLRRQRGLSERTIGHCWRFADRFLAFRFGEGDVRQGAGVGRIIACLE
jgi:integrase/recombinase XerD